MKLKPLAVFAACLFALGTLLSSTPRAYSVLGYTWPASSMPVRYYINPNNMDVPTAAVAPAVRAGADAWQLQSGASFVFMFAGFSTQTTNTNDGTNLVMFRNA